MNWLHEMPAYKRAIMLGMIVLFFVGVFDAWKNLPIVSGCAFYGNCSAQDITNPPSDLGFDPVDQ